MAKKSMSNRAQVEKILQSAQKAIAKAEKSGQTVPDNIKKIASTPIKSRYSKREVEGIKYHLDPRHISAEARKSKVLTFTTNEGGTHELRVRATPKEFHKKLGEEVYKGIKYALEHHPSRDFDIDLRKFLKHLGYNVKKLQWESLNNKNFIINTFKEIKMNDFIKKFVEKYDDSETSYFYAGVEALVGSGRFSETEYKKYEEFAKQKAMASFAKNLKITPERAQTIYDFFQKSDVWSTYRKNFKPSNDISIETLLGDIEEALDSGINVSDIDGIIDNNMVKGDTTLVRIALENAIQNATKSN